MKLIITVKPSIAQTIAKHLGADTLIGTFKDGAYYEGENYIVTCYMGWTLQSIPEDGVIRNPHPQIRPYEEIIELPEYKKQYDLLQGFMINERFKEIILLADSEEEIENGIFHYLYKKNSCKIPYKAKLIFSLSHEEISRLVNE